MPNMVKLISSLSLPSLSVKLKLIRFCLMVFVMSLPLASSLKAGFLTIVLPALSLLLLYQAKIPYRLREVLC